jgi:hypothetical protein
VLGFDVSHILSALFLVLYLTHCLILKNSMCIVDFLKLFRELSKKMLKAEETDVFKLYSLFKYFFKIKLDMKQIKLINKFLHACISKN